MSKKIDRPAWVKDIRISASSVVVKQKSNNQKIQLRNVFGYFELNIVESASGLLLILTPRANEPIYSMRHLLKQILAFYFGEAQVQEVESSNNLSIRTLGAPWSQVEIAEKIKLVFERLSELPSRRSASHKTIVSSPEFVENLQELRDRYFSKVPMGRFMLFAKAFIPFFVSRLPALENLVLVEDIFSTKPLKEDEVLSRQVSVLFALKVKVLDVRNAIRKNFLKEFMREVSPYLIYLKAVKEWGKLKKHKWYVKTSGGKIYLDAIPHLEKRLEGTYRWKFALGPEMPSYLYPFGAELSYDRKYFIVPRPKERSLVISEEVVETFGEGVFGMSSTEVGEALFSSEAIRNAGVYDSEFNPHRAGPHLEDYEMLPQVGDQLEASGNNDELSGLSENFGFDSDIPQTSLDELRLSGSLLFKIKSIPHVETLEQLSRISAKELYEKYQLTGEDFAILLPELTSLGFDLLIPYKWDMKTFRLLNQHPEYIRYRHTSAWVKWYMSVPSDNSGRGND